MTDTRSFEQTRTDLLSARPDLFTVNSKYAPKLTHADRCAMLLFHKLGISTPVLAVAFGINRATVRYVSRTSSRHYKSVRAEWATLGPDAFKQRYWTQDWQDAVNKAKDAPEAKVTDDLERELKADRSAVPDKRATHRKGRFVIAASGSTFVADFRWFDTIPPDGALDEDGEHRLPGWYCVVKGEGPISGLNEARYTSSKALASLLRMTEGELQK